MKPIVFLLLVLPLVMGACVSNEQRSAERGPTPAQIVESGESAAPVHWGGQIVRVENLSDRTLIEVLAFPLDGGGRPQTDQVARGRFMIESPGFLEPHEYAPDRLIEVRGKLSGFRNGRVGEAEYRYPLVMAERLTLRATNAAGAASGGTTGFRFGFGTSTFGSGSGIGISF